MSAIRKIRDNSLLIIIVVGVAMLLFIIDPTQVINWLGGSQRNDVIGEFRGEKISSTDWKYDLYTQGAQDEQQKAQIFNEMIKDTIFKMELAKLGLEGLAKEELNALIWGESGVRRHPNIENIPDFKDMNDQFSVDSLNKKLPQILSNPTMRPRWKQFFEEPMKQQRNQEKYLNMVRHGLYVTSYEVKEELKNEQTKLDLMFAYRSYASVSDSLVSYTEKDLKDFYEKNKKKEEYKQQTEVRTFDYIDIEVVPSEADKEKALDRISLLKEDFIASKNDSLFVARFAETSQFDGIYRKANFFPAELDAQLQQADSATIIGPYISEGFYKISKVVGTKPEKEATVRHILIGYNGDNSDENDKKIKNRADSVLRVVRSQKNFEELVEKLSDDPGSKSTGGKYEWFAEGQMVKEFNDFSFEKPIGSLGVVKTTFGYHIIEVLDRRQGKTFKVATVDARITPQEDTKNEFYDRGLEIYNKAQEIGFEKAVEEMGYISKTEVLNLSTPRINNPALNNNSTIIRWVFNAKANEVSEPFLIGDRVVVATVTDIKEEGIMSFEAAKEKITTEVIKLKKAEYLKSLVAGSVTVPEAAKKMNVEPQEQMGLTYNNNNIAGATGNEAETVGKIFALDVNKYSGPIQGKSGVFVVMVTSKGERLEPSQEDLDARWSTMLSTLKGRAQSGPINALLKQADVKDHRKRLELKD